MKRLHVHVSVPDLAESIKFYSGMFAAEPTVVKADYAKWMLDDPRVNFAISRRGATQVGVNHLGIQVEDAGELKEMQGRLGALQADVEAEQGAACCYAKSDKYWVNDPAGIAWETFHTLGSIPVFGDAASSSPEEPASGCCVPAPKAATSCCAPAASTGGTTTGCCG